MSFTVEKNYGSYERPMNNEEIKNLKESLTNELTNYIVNKIEIKKCDKKLEKLNISIETHKKNAIQHEQNAIQHEQNAIKLKEESIKLKEESVKLKEESIKLKEESIQHNKNAEEKRKQAKEVTFICFCRILNIKPNKEEREDICENYLSAISFDLFSKSFELNMTTFVKYLENHEKQIGETLNFVQFKKISNIADLAKYSNKTETCAFKFVKLIKEVKEGEEFKKIADSFNKKVTIL